MRRSWDEHQSKISTANSQDTAAGCACDFFSQPLPMLPTWNPNQHPGQIRRTTQIPTQQTTALNKNRYNRRTDLSSHTSQDIIMYGNATTTRTEERKDGFLTPTKFARARPDEMGGRHSATGGHQNVGRGGGRGRGSMQQGGRGRGNNDSLFAALDDTNIVTPLHQRKPTDGISSDADTPTIRNGTGNGNDTPAKLATQLTSVQEAILSVIFRL